MQGTEFSGCRYVFRMFAADASFSAATTVEASFPLQAPVVYYDWALTFIVKTVS